MRKTFIILLIFALLITIFTVQNASIITVKLFIWHFNISLALIILISVIIGAVIAYCLSIKNEVKLKKENKRLNQKISTLNNELKIVNNNENLKLQDNANDKKENI